MGDLGLEWRDDIGEHVSGNTRIYKLIPSAFRCFHGDIVPPGHTSVYEIWDFENRLMYAGVTGNVRQRLNHHRLHKPWWVYAEWADITCWDTRAMGLHVEAHVIWEQSPIFNLAGRNVRGGTPNGVVQSR